MQKSSKSPCIIKNSPNNNKLKNKIPTDISVLLPKKKKSNILLPNKTSHRNTKTKNDMKKTKNKNPWNNPIKPRTLRDKKIDILLLKVNTNLKNMEKNLLLKCAKIEKQCKKITRNTNRIFNLMKTLMQAQNNNGEEKIVFIDKGYFFMNIILKNNGNDTQNIEENVERIFKKDNNLYVNKTIVLDKIDEIVECEKKEGQNEIIQDNQNINKEEVCKYQK